MKRNDVTPRTLINAAIQESLPLLSEDKKAEKRYLSVFLESDNLFLLNEDTLAMLKAYAEKGNPHAQYALGRYHIIVQPEADSVEQAERMYTYAYEHGVVDAGAAMIGPLKYGMFGKIDVTRAKDLLEETLEKGSRLAAMKQLSNLMYGFDGVEQNHGKALTIINELIEMDGEDDVVWMAWKANALLDIYGAETALPYYEKAAKMGSLSAMYVLPYAVEKDEDGEPLDKKAYLEVLKRGMEMECYDCFYQYAMTLEDEEEVEQVLKKAVELGSPQAARFLGDYYRQVGDIEDAELREYYYQQAWLYYSAGARYASKECMERMYDMADEQVLLVPEERKNVIAIVGARRGSQKLINAVVDAYKQGKLTEFAAEIEQYHLPKYDAEWMEEDDEDEEPDDDGSYDAYA